MADLLALEHSKNSFYSYKENMAYNFTDKTHQETLLLSLNNQRKEESHLCDITIKTKDDQGKWV